MPRNTRLIIPNICHHAIQRGNNRQDVFQEKEDRFYYLKWAGELAERYHVPIIGYCLMTSHTHLLVLPRSEAGMINFMKLLAQRYTQYYNRKYHRSGKLWENRYKLHPVDPDVYYVVLRYIERNPVKAGMVADGADYPWSSGSYHLLGREDKTIKADYLHDSAFSYREFFYEQERSKDVEAIRDAAQQGKAWGRAAFLERLGNKLNRVVVPRKRGRPKKVDK
jgi:putative transposase